VCDLELINRALRLRISASLIAMALVNAAIAWPSAVASSGNAMPTGKVPEHTIIVKGAWPSASDPATPLPERGRLAHGRYRNDYFGLSLRYSARWRPGLEGPPPSDAGFYVLAQIVPARRFETEKRGYLLITAEDIFFSASQARSALELIDFTRERLNRSVYRVERAPQGVQLNRHSFIRFAYLSPIAGMHWTVLATEIRCHIVEFVFVSTNPGELSDLLQAMNTITLPATAGVHGGTGGGAAPLCIKDYASTANVIRREAPILTEPRYNPVPVRIIIGRNGKVEHIHFLRAFPDQVKAITDALRRWRFKPLVVDGQPVEVETGIMFGRGAQEVLPVVAPARHHPPAVAGG
jgi:hypothetical protein